MHEEFETPGGLLITGVSGYLGRQLGRMAGQAGGWSEVTGTYWSHPVEIPGVQAVKLDLSDPAAVASLVQNVRPRVVVHTAISYGPDQRPVIVDGTRHITQAAERVGARLIHLSTDVLHDGEHGPYADDTPPTPIHEYGRAKAEAESQVLESGGEWLIVRTSLIFGFDPPDRQLFWLLNSVRGDKPIQLYTNELRNPVWVDNLAEALLELATRSEVRGYLNVAGAQAVNRYELGLKFLNFLGMEPRNIEPALSAGLAQNRPRDVRLKLDRAQAVLRTRLLGVDEVLESLLQVRAQILNMLQADRQPE
jgi:dTDP-4-dehydrorhamnose reductase